MTICIAAICDGGSKIVMLADTLLTSGTNKAGSLSKLRHISPCVVATAGDLFTTEAVHDGAYSAKGFKAFSDCVAAYEATARKVRESQIEREVTLKLGYSVERFRTQGLKELGPTYMETLNNSIQKIATNSVIMIAGFTDRPKIAYLEGAGPVLYGEVNTFLASGDGHPVAVHCLRQSKITPNTSLPATIYSAFFAKKQAESVASVGPDTDIWVMSRQGSGAPDVVKLGESVLSALGAAYLKATALPDLSGVSTAITSLGLSLAA